VGDTVFKIDQKLPQHLYVGRGVVLAVSGICFNPNKIVRSISIVIGTSIFPVQQINICQIPEIPQSQQQLSYPRVYNKGFYGHLHISGKFDEGRYTIKANILFSDGDSQIFTMGDIAVYKNPLHPVSIETSKHDDLVVICMASFNPRIDFLTRQIESIKQQTHGNWICIISDDASDDVVYKQIASICSQDYRFHLFRNHNRLGFYRNFERCLSMVPQEAKFVAMSDQDDYWYSDKLSLCLDAIDQTHALVYSDMRIIDDKGVVISDTFWKHRKRNDRDLDVMLISNSITGASALFRRDMLEYLLPFPSAPGRCFHDHWLSCVALNFGEIKYLDIPLYDYIQHSSNVIGHRQSSRYRIYPDTGFFTKVSGIFNRIFVTMDQVARCRHMYSYIYKTGFCMVSIFNETLQLRFQKSRHKGHAFISLLSSGWQLIPRLIRLHFKVLIQNDTTNGAEVLIAVSYLHHKMKCAGKKLRGIWSAG